MACERGETIIRAVAVSNVRTEAIVLSGKGSRGFSILNRAT